MLLGESTFVVQGIYSQLGRLRDGYILNSYPPGRYILRLHRSPLLMGLCVTNPREIRLSGYNRNPEVLFARALAFWEINGMILYMRQMRMQY